MRHTSSLIWKWEKPLLNQTSRRNAIKILATGVAAPGAAQALDGPAAPSAESGDILVTQFGARGNGNADDTAAFERAIRTASEQGRRLRIPAGRYRITRTLTINRGIRIEGDGIERSVILAASGKGRPVIHVEAKTTDSIMGFALSGIRLLAAVPDDPCDGIRLSTAGNGAAIHQTTLRDIHIVSTGTGVSLAGVVYRSCFENISVTGHVTRYGFYCDAGFEDVTYNSFRDLEVTHVRSGAYAYWIHSNYSNFTNLTADGCCYFSSPGGSIRNLAIETITAEKPPSDIAIQLNQVQIAECLNLIGVDRRKCLIGVRVIGQGLSLRAIRLVAPQPDRAVIFDAASEGTLTGVYVDQSATRIEDYTPVETLDRWVVQAAQAVTRPVRSK
ncbi:glycoside hydrolase family 55 protein [Sphingomonas radiodurans]|uniref:glycoside hydrolase family 55 protein n=1 Tax=Sphingomonas radiodurans TaxID=2890321 RepID=UPI001E528CAA|nr:glycoside hydrolase family 55 protein [Sphingomonas radiodurans]WBH15097.1 glycoside hydrolase family 55 protein [Sphingomonas radiodurans]